MNNFYNKLLITIVFTLFLSVSQLFAQLHNTTFTSLASGTRDSSADKGAVYYLDGNTTNGRLNLGANAVWEVGDNTHILVNGNSNHSYMNGIIRSTGLVYVGKPNGASGRFDFSGPNGGMQAHDITYLYLGDGSVFNHLENSRNQFTGFVRFILDMSGGTAFIQFASREYANVTIDVRPSNVSVTNIYPARSSAGFTSFPGFTTKNLTSTLTLLKGTQSTSHGRIYDPVYEGIANNLLPIRRSGGGASNDSKEYFTIDVTEIVDNGAKIRVTDSNNIVQHNDIALTTANTIIYANDGTTPLAFYSGKNVVSVQVRNIEGTTSTTRNTIYYLIRRLGFEEIKVDNLAMNNPVVIEEMLVDSAWSNTGIITEISNLDELYDEAKKVEFNDLTLPIIASTNGTELNLGSYNLVVDATATSVFSVDMVTNSITIKASILNETNQFNTITTTGTVSLVNGATISDAILVRDANFTPSPAYTVVGNVITLLSGFTETDLSGMRGLEGVSFNIIGGITSYTLNNHRLVINGVLSQDPDTEQLQFGKTISNQSLIVNGTYNYGLGTTLNGYTRTSSGTGLIITQENNSSFDNPVLDVTATGTFNWNGGKIQSSGTLYFRASSTVNITNGILELPQGIENQFIRSFTTSLSINGLIKIGGGVILYQSPTMFRGYEPIHSPDDPIAGRNGWALLLYGPPAGTANEIIVRDYQGLGNFSDIGFIDRSFGKFVNAQNGSGTTVTAWLEATARSDGYQEFTKEIDLTVIDDNDITVSDVLFFVRDTNNGSRVNQNGRDDTADKIYSETSDANGQLSTEITTVVFNSVNGAINTDRRSANNDTTDTFDMHLWHYIFEYKGLNRSLIGTGSLALTERIFTDQSITQPLKATVDAYTSIDNLDQLYDRAKSWKVDTANIEYPTISTQPITSNGTTLDLGNQNLVLDATAGSVFAINTVTNTITVRSNILVGGTKFTNITTTGTVSTLNGETLEFGYMDSSGINKFVLLDWGANTLQNVSAINLDNNNSILNNIPATQTYKGHFIFPNPAPTIGLRVQITTPAGYMVYGEAFPEADLNFIRTDITLIASEGRQTQMLYLAQKVLQKTEAVNEGLGGTTPPITDNSVVTTSNQGATNENQVAILNLLRRILIRSSANHEALQNE